MRTDRRPAGFWIPAAAGVLGALREAVFPNKCLECGRLLPPSDAVRFAPHSDPLPVLSPYFCRECLQGVTLLAHPMCWRCGVMFKSSAGEDRLCGRCIETPPAFHMARAGFAYDLSLVDVIHCFKYKGKTQLAGPLGTLLAETYRRHWGSEPAELAMPVPLHPRRLKERGFNQAFLLLRRCRGWSGGSFPPIESGVLQRVKATIPQAGLGRGERAVNIGGAFAVRRSERIAGKHLLLVDDVITTGATVGACAQVLLDHGARRVDVLALARAL